MVEDVATCCRTYLSYVLHLQCVAIVSLDTPSKGGGHKGGFKTFAFFYVYAVFLVHNLKKHVFSNTSFHFGGDPKVIKSWHLDVTFDIWIWILDLDQIWIWILTSGCQIHDLDLDLFQILIFILDLRMIKMITLGPPQSYKRSLKNTFFDGSVPRTRQRTKKSEIFFFLSFRPSRGGVRNTHFVFGSSFWMWSISNLRFWYSRRQKWFLMS